MLHVIILILKIIGFLILGILGLLLGLLLLVLFVPVRYQIQGSFYGKPEGTVRVTWLLHMISVLVSYQEELQIAVRFCGFRLFRETGDAAEDLIEDETDELLHHTEEGTLHAMEVTRDRVEDPILKEQDKPNRNQDTTGDMDSLITEEVEEEDGLREPESPVPFWQRFITGIIEKITAVIQSVCTKLSFVMEKKEQTLAFFQDEENKKTFKLICRQLKRLFRHILPKKVRGTVTFGFEDPYITGQVLAAAAMFYGWYGKGLQITPVFDEQVIEGEGFLKGRIRMGTVLILGIRILLNKNFRVLLKRWRGKGGVSDGR